MIDAASATWRVCLCRKETGIENRLVSVTANGQTTTFTYDGDGRRVKKVDAGGTTYTPGEHYEVKGGVITKYYTLGGQRVAMKAGSSVYWLHGDHLGSASLTTNPSGGIYAQQRYLPYGEVRWSSGTLPTDFTYTGQRNETALGIYDYRARFYSPRLGRFLSADTVVPGVGSQHLSRYMYVRGNPVRRADPDGHMDVDDGRSGGIPRPSPRLQPQPYPAPVAPRAPNITLAPTGIPFVGPAIVPWPAPIAPTSIGTPNPSPWSYPHRAGGLNQAQASSYYDFQGNLPNCGPHSAAMAANVALGHRRFTGAQIAQDMNRAGLTYRVPPNLTGQWGYTFPWGIAAYLNGREGLSAQDHYGASSQDLLISLDKGHIPMVLIEPLSNQAHWMTLYGYDPNGSMSNIPNPAWGFLNPNTGTSNIFWRSTDWFADRWSGIYVEVWSR